MRAAQDGSALTSANMAVCAQDIAFHGSEAQRRVPGSSVWSAASNVLCNGLMKTFFVRCKVVIGETAQKRHPRPVTARRTSHLLAGCVILRGVFHESEAP